MTIDMHVNRRVALRQEDNNACDNYFVAHRKLDATFRGASAFNKRVGLVQAETKVLVSQF